MTREQSDEQVLASRGCLWAVTPLAEAQRLISASDASVFVVVDDGGPVGVVTAERLGTEPRSTQHTVADVMDFELVAIEHGADINDTMRIYERAGWDSLLRRRPFASPDRSATVGSAA